MKLHNSLTRFIGLLLLCGPLHHAMAAGTVVLDSYGPGNAVDGWPSLLYQDSGGRQDVAIPFVISSATSVQSILTSIEGQGGVTLGILSRQGAVPLGNTWLFSTHLDNPSANTTLNPAGWTLAPGSYWLAAVADNGFAGTWQSGTDTPTAHWAYSTAPGAWTEVSSGFTGLPAARITVAAAVPEPASVALMLAGGVFVAAAVRRQTHRQQG